VITIVVAGRNDDYGGGFTDRLLGAWGHNLAQLADAGVSVELLFVEWNPLPDRPLLSRRILAELPSAQAIVVPQAVHARYRGNPQMPFHEMPAKNVGIRHASGDWVLVANADVVLGRDLIAWMAQGHHDPDTLYRAHRVDVPHSTPFDRIEEPNHQLASGEGAVTPCEYLGAGGDFCFASRALWLRLEGFDEAVRFTTRGKDWQFFLSARERHVPIAFVGRVYHLDHEGGFRNTPAGERAGHSVHFGPWWDLEAAVPIRNAPDWGLASAVLEQDAREPRFFRVPSAARWTTRDDTTGLSPSELGYTVGHLDHVSRAVLHLFIRAARERRRVVADFEDPSALLALAGLAAVARPFGVETCSRRCRPKVAWACAPVRFAPDLRLRGSDLVLRMDDGHVVATCSADEATPRHTTRDTDLPEFNPLLARRLLRAWLTLDADGARRVAIYGAGSHTDQVLRWGIPAGVTLTSIVVTGGDPRVLRGVSVTPISMLDSNDVDAVLVSSATYEPEMCETARSLGFRVAPLYADWPRSFWSAAPAPVDTELAAPPTRAGLAAPTPAAHAIPA
jgi:hypothetical protein